jgi:ribosomal protein S18 acetylase RimI-like enzyme
MKYYLQNATHDAKDFIYNVKKASNYYFIQRIWGWNEEYQIKDFEKGFNVENIKIISVADNPDNINITELHIIPVYQGFGIGTSIISDIMKQAVYKRKTVTIGCFIENIRAKKLYERLGFKIMSILDTHYEMIYSFH